MNKITEEKKVILPLVAITCAPDRRCCGFGNDCPATFKIFKDKLVFDMCKCM